MTEYSQNHADNICSGIAQGKSLVTVCKEHKIEYRHVFKWIAEHPQFKDNYIRARETQADYLAEEIIDIADTEIDPAKARVRVDVRKWYAGKLKPKKYGDSTQIKHADADGGILTLKSVLGEINGTTANLPRDEEIPE